MENPLTPREAEVLQCFADGMICKEIAKHLHLALHTVFNYNDSIKGKLTKTTLPGCVAEGIRRKIIH